MSHLKRPSAPNLLASPQAQAKLVRRLRSFIKRGEDLLALLEKTDVTNDEWQETTPANPRQVH